MKYIFLIAIAGIITGCKQPQPKTGWATMGLKGPVKQVTEYVYSDGRQPKVNSQSPNRVIIFDENGNKLSETQLDSGETVKTVFGYSKKMIADTTFINDTIAGHEKQLVGDDGHVSEIDIYTGNPKQAGGYGKYSFRSVNHYDNAGNLEEADNYDDGNKLTSKNLYHYDKSNHIVETDITAPAGRSLQTAKTFYVNDAGGNTVKQTAYDFAGKFIYTNNFSFGKSDQQGNWLQSTSWLTDENGKSPKDYSEKTIVVRKIEYFK